jgi:hypothetical protein
VRGSKQSCAHERSTMNKTLHVVRLLDPHQCLTCRFATVGIVETEPGKEERMVQCSRGDCDNWDFSTIRPAVRIVESEGPVK